MLENIENEMRELREEVASLVQRIGLLDRELAPVWHAEQEIKEAIKATHGRTATMTVVFDPAGRDARAPLFAELLAIAVEHGPVKSARSELAQRSRAYQRRIEILEKEAQRSKVKGKKMTPPKQADLF